MQMEHTAAEGLMRPVPLPSVNPNDCAGRIQKIQHATELNSKWLQEGPCLCPRTTAVSLWAHSGRSGGGHTHCRDRGIIRYVIYDTSALSVLYIYLLAGLWQVLGSTHRVSYLSSERWAGLMRQLRDDEKPPFVSSWSILTPLAALF